MSRITRYQAVIVRGDEILLIKNHEILTGKHYWLLPGGGKESGETEYECVQREVLEETNLEVNVLGLLLDEPPGRADTGSYRRYKSYLCRPLTTDAAPGWEPEPEVAALVRIVDVGWFNFRDETFWDDLLRNDPITAPVLRRIRSALDLPPRASWRED